MRPDPNQVTIPDNLLNIRSMLQELILRPRRELTRWAALTKQTPNIKIGYTGQHLASLVTGVEGARTGARGHDLTDGSEVKSCSRVDQLDKCKSCNAAVARLEHECPECRSNNIKRNNDSKWLLTVRSEDELTTLLDRVPRVLFILSDYPNFIEQDWNTLQFQIFEIWPQDQRHRNFRTLMHNYFYNIYLPHIEKNARKTPAPKNFWPYSFQFYMCNPVRIFNCITTGALENAPRFEDVQYIEPLTDRQTVEPVPMPLSLLKPNELQRIRQNIGNNAYAIASAHGLDATQRLYVELRGTDHAAPQEGLYHRGGR